MSQGRSPTFGLLAGLAITLSAVALYSGYTVMQLRGLERLQGGIIDRNRADSLLLLRIQNNLNSLGLAMRDMLDGSEPYPLTAWQGQFRRMRTDLEDAIAREAQSSPRRSRCRTAQVPERLAAPVLGRARPHLRARRRAARRAEARTLIRLSLQARQEALSTAVARLLVQNNEIEQQAGTRIRGVYAGVERNVYLFVAAMLVLILLTSLYLVQLQSPPVQEVATLSARRSELAQQLIAMQENTFRSISRDLHDDFGQILTAIGTMLQRTGRRLDRLRLAPHGPARGAGDRAGHARKSAHAVSRAASGDPGRNRIRRRAGSISARLPETDGDRGALREVRAPARELDREVAIHLYRVMQEALNNIAKHSQSNRAVVRLRYLPETVVLEVEDHGVGFGSSHAYGMGLVSMRERAGLVNGLLDLENPQFRRRAGPAHRARHSSGDS